MALSVPPDSAPAGERNTHGATNWRRSGPGAIRGRGGQQLLGVRPGPARSPPGRPASGRARAPGPLVQQPDVAPGDRSVVSVLSTTTWGSANAATCGRWVTTTTWWSRASRASRRPDLDGRPAADPGVDLVEDERRHGVGAGEDHLDREHHPGELAAGRACAGSAAAAPRGAAASSSSTSSAPCRADAPAVRRPARPPAPSVGPGRRRGAPRRSPRRAAWRVRPARR